MKSGITKRLTPAVIGLALGPLLLLGLLDGVRLYQQHLSQVGRHLDELALRVATQVTDELDDGRQALEVLDLFEDFATLPRTTQHLRLEELLARRPGLRSIMLLDARGQELVRVSSAELVLERDLVGHAGEPRFEAPWHTAAPYFGAIRLDPYTAEPLLAYSLPLVDRVADHVLGVVSADLRLHGVWKLIAGVREPDTDIYLLDDHDRVIAHPNPSVVLRGTRVDLVPGERDQPGLAGEPALIAESPVRLGDRVFRLVAERSRESVRRGALQHLAVLGVAALAGLLAAIVAVGLVLRWIVRPVKAVAATSRAIADGDLGATVQIRGNDELGDLARSFNEMTGQLRRTLGKLETEIAGRRATESALRRSETQARLLLEASGEGIIGIDLDGRCTFCNPAAMRMLGFEQVEQLLGSPLHELIHHSHRDGSICTGAGCRILEAADNEQSARTDDELFRRTDGRSFPVDYQAHPIRHQGQVVGTVLNFVDISERHRFEEMLRQRIELEKLVSSLARRFVNLRPDEVEGGIERELIRLGHFAGVDRSYLFLFSADGARFSNRIEWCAEGIAPQIDELQDLATEDFSSVLSHLAEHQVIHVPEVAALGDDQIQLRSLLESGGVRSLVNVPIWVGGRLYGFIGFDSVRSLRQWGEEDIGLLHTVASVFAAGLERREAELALQRQAHHDPLTRLPNRVLLGDRLDHAVERARWHGRSVGVLFIDLDRFKNINDSLGHAIGDAVLGAAAERLRGCLRPEDTVARIGGDEFVVLQEDQDQPAGSASAAEAIIDAFAEPLPVDHGELFITPSIGISLFPRDGDSAETLLRNADAAMYRAKDQGRNNYQFYTESLTERARERVLLEHELRFALKDEALSLRFQPQLSLRERRIVGVEALLRWHHHELGDVSPGRFVPVAEDSGLILPIGEWVLRRACRQLADWIAAGLDIDYVAVNVAGAQVWHGAFPEVVRSALAETGLDPHRLELEVTEGFVMGKGEEAVSLVERLHDIGVRLAIDDFGTGYSSLGYLKRLTIDRLKIDQGFVRGLPDDPDDVAIARAVIALGHSMQFAVIAEGVETPAQAGWLADEGCDMLQGYLIARPLSPEDVLDLLGRGSVGGLPDDL